MDYFRAVLKRKEISDRAFLLSKKVINLVSANYTAWQFRRQCIEKLGKNLDTELAYTRKIALDSPKKLSGMVPSSGDLWMEDPGRSKAARTRPRKRFDRQREGTRR